jgi:NADPH:quinone reductase
MGKQMMKTVRFHEYGGPSVLKFEEGSIGDPGANEVRLVQEAIGLNFVDTMLRDGTFRVPLPSGIGFEAAGTIGKIGSRVAGFSVGDRVGYYYAENAYATERLISARDLVLLPQDISTEQSAAFLAKGLTAWMGLRVLSQVKAGDAVVVLGASGSVGAIVSRWARAMGATVIGIAGSIAKLEKVAAGSDLALAADDPDLTAKIASVAPNGSDVVFDFVGRATEVIAVQAVKAGGRILTIGAASGQPQFDRLTLANKRVSVQGGSTPQAVTGEKVAIATAELFSAIRTGLFADLEISRYPFDDVVGAHADLSSRKIDGLPILIP